MNLATIILTVIVASVFLAIVVMAIRNRKTGKGGCPSGGSCGGCGMRGSCHPK